jgi:CheY-like chemotaxis protein
LIPEAPVLIVDDNELNVLVAKRMVSNWGYEVVSANGVKQAEMHLRSAQPFLVLLDIHMPEVDGFHATKRWRQSSEPWSNVPIVGLTADAESKTRNQALEVGMNDVVVKPFNPPHLRSVIERFGLEHAQRKQR